jgi:hypothetical protein
MAGMNDDSLDKLIRDKVREQETTYPSPLPHRDILWQSLNERRDRQKTKQRQLLWRVAASVLIVMMAGYVYVLHNQYSNDAIVVQSPALATQSVSGQNALDYIARYCAEKKSSCDTPALQALRSDLEESFRKLEEIDQRLRFYGKDADLIRARVRVESHQARVLKTIVQTL